VLILRMITLLHKRILSCVITPSTEASKAEIDLEQLLSLSSSLTSGVDDMAASLWSPQDLRQVASRAATVQDRVQALREYLVASGSLPSHSGSQIPDSLIDRKDIEWFQMCFAQIDKAVNNTINT
jgi:hypothetical protein